MDSVSRPLQDAVQDALLAAVLFARDPVRLGGLVVKAHAGPVRTRYLDFLKSHLASGVVFRKLPLNIPDERLIGGLDLAATLHAGRPILSRGLLAEANGGILMVPMAERISPELTARLASVLDRKEVVIAREGLSAVTPTRFGLVLLDESVAQEECIAPELLDRLALHVDLCDVHHAALDEAIAWFDEMACPVAITSEDAPADGSFAACVPVADDETTRALCAAAIGLGIDSIRAAIFARRVTEISSQWLGKARTDQEDAELAARLVLAPRATIIPEPPPEEDADQKPEDEACGPQDLTETDSEPTQTEHLDDIVLEAAKAAIPAGLLAQLLANQKRLSRAPGSGRSGALKKGGARGRPLGARQGMPYGRARLSLIDTLRAAAPWQKLRGPSSSMNGSRPVHRNVGRRLQIRSEDFRIKRFKEKAETTTIFVVDASGSSALHRLAEAKGAVELLLADCYVRRDQVAVVAFRGQQAEVILPPTRSLVRAKRSLSGLPGGGGTPLAAGLEAGQLIAESVARRGETPILVILTDGKANIDRAGQPGREQAQRDAMQAARNLAMSGFAMMVIDTSPQPSAAAQLLSGELRARYMPLPHAGAVEVSQAIKAMA